MFAYIKNGCIFGSQNNNIMTYKTLNTVEKITKNSLTISIIKISKVGTNKVFFTPEIEGKRLTTTLFARLYDARDLAKKFLKQNAK